MQLHIVLITCGGCCWNRDQAEELELAEIVVEDLLVNIGVDIFQEDLKQWLSRQW